MRSRVLMVMVVAGLMLPVVGGVAGGSCPSADLTGDFFVNFKDYAVLAEWWLEDCNSFNNFCEGADFDLSGQVDANDLAILTGDWLGKCTAVHLWANLSRKKCSWAQIYYQQKRLEGKSHACALRCLGQRWLKILCKMWQTRKPYDEQMHTRNQIQHGSWVLSLTPEIKYRSLNNYRITVNNL